MNCAANGLYTANVIVTDNVTGESIWVNAGWYNITGYSAPLTVGKPNAVITEDACGFLVFKPEITGGSGQYAITYCLYDDSFIQHAAYPYNVDVCYMGCPDERSVCFHGLRVGSGDGRERRGIDGLVRHHGTLS